MKKKIFKTVALTLAISMVYNIFYPTVALALTGGPSQPEVESFEPVGTTDMVDLFSGDFNYNIPLLTVPGPNGGYPVNLAYHAGIGMEQEASWVGLGWNINAGVINRDMRGIPDDFNGDVIIRELRTKPNWTVGVELEQDPTALNREVFGLKTQVTPSYQLYYNNYKGVGVQANLSLKTLHHKGTTPADFNKLEGFMAVTNLGFDSQSGLGFSPSISYGKKLTSSYMKFNGGISFNSREGVNGIWLKAHKFRTSWTSKTNDGGKLSTELSPEKIRNKLNNPGRGSGVSFSGSSFVPHVTTPMKGGDASIKFKRGTEALFTFGNARGLNGSFSRHAVKDVSRNIPAYGYNYVQNRTNNPETLTDLNREKEVPVSKRVPSLPVPSFTNDVYYVKGQGIGGVYRPFRSDIGILSDPNVKSDFHKGDLGFDLAPGAADAKFGLDLGYGFTRSFSGNWQANNTIISNLNFQNSTTDIPLYEPFYFKAAGEQTASSASEFDYIGGESAKRFHVFRKWDDISFKPAVDNTGGTSGILSRRTERQKRVQSIQLRTVDQIKKSEEYTDGLQHKNICATNTWPGTGSNPYTFSFATTPVNHTGEISVLNPDGNLYVYGLPAYNNTQHDVAFSIGTQSGYPKLVSYDSDGSNNNDDNSANNKKGTDHFYSRTKTPAYAHSYLLTEILSSDFVDITRNGPTDDDMGYFVKFNYSELDYKWRVPFYKANYSKGYFSNTNDDKASYTYGEKKLCYLNSIETKTHIAEFEIAQREDGLGVPYENSADKSSVQCSTACGPRQYYLKEIRLYSKEDRNNPIKTVHFDYNYDLCGNVDNNSGNNSAGNNSKKGKLTLKKVWFTYLGNTKGELSPYQFSYNEGTAAENPDYDQAQMDRWGNFRKKYGTGTLYDRLYNHENPFTYQNQDYDRDGDIDQTDIDLRNQDAAVWNLKKITLPSGGEITINYEADNYAYIQDKRAMQMMRIVGTSKTTQSTPEVDNGLSKTTGPYLRIYFELEKACTTDAAVYEYIKDLDKVYFKTYQKLKDMPPGSSGTAYDYVDGYAEIEKASGTYGRKSSDDNIGFLTVKKVDYYGKGSLRQTHPFCKAGWQYLKLERPDLFQTVNDAAGATIQLNMLYQAFSVMKELFRMLADFYNFCDLAGYASKMDVGSSDVWPSFLRLNSPDYIKYGGGHRVKSILLNDKWSAMDNQQSDFSYGTQYEYTTTAGISSGVAEYEPLIGGEEIPHRRPVSYNGNDKKYSLRNEETYIEEPYGESLYPAANVGYGRVVVKNLDHGGVSKTASGINVTEFYTAKDFPIKKMEQTDLLQAKYNRTIMIPFAGFFQFANNGYSQGYKIELNDMHGKLKSQSTWSYIADITKDKPVMSSEYIYKTQNPFTALGPNYLDNTVDVLYGDAKTEEAMLGITHDFFIDMREDYTKTTSGAGEFNIDVKLPVLIPTFWPNIQRIESMMRFIVTNKIIYRTGILEETRTFNEGALVTTKNLLYDSETGTPLLSQVTNEFDKPVYNYKFAGHWAHEGMNGAYKNAGSICNITTNSSSIASIDITGVSNENAWDYVFPGDEVEVTQSGTVKKYWVYIDMCDRNSFTLLDKNNNPITANISSGCTMKVVRSGRRNLQSTPNGTIVSLSNPTQGRSFPLFNLYNTAIAQQGASYPLQFTEYFDCGGHNCSDVPDTIGATIYTCATKTRLDFAKQDCDENVCTSYILFDKVISNADLIGYTLAKYGNKVVGTRASDNSKIYGDWIDMNGCYSECINDVLHADATEHAPNWYNYPYADVGNPFGFGSGTDPDDNPFRYGFDGIWRTHRQQVYQVDRNQTTPGTNIAVDGTYKNFRIFNWLPSKLYDDPLLDPLTSTQFENTNNNPKWTWTNEVSRYSPYGFELENRNKLDIYSAALYGYDNALTTAVVQNAWYFESGYDGFEDYSSGYSGHGHIVLKDGSGNMPSNVSSGGHTGKYSISLANDLHHKVTSQNPSPGTEPTVVALKAGKKYLVDAWFKTDDAAATPQIRVLVSGSPIATSTVVTRKIEGWTKVEVTFDAPATSVEADIEFRFTGKTSGTYYLMDDVRVQPFKSAMTSYVYDPVTLWLTAELDNRNFATFYNYDEEGSLIQVKKETERGIMTIKSSRNNIKSQ